MYWMHLFICLFACVRMYFRMCVCVCVLVTLGDRAIHMINPRWFVNARVCVCVCAYIPIWSTYHIYVSVCACEFIWNFCALAFDSFISRPFGMTAVTSRPKHCSYSNRWTQQQNCYHRSNWLYIYTCVCAVCIVYRQVWSTHELLHRCLYHFWFLHLACHISHLNVRD